MVVLAVASAQRLNITEMWIAFGAGKNFRYLPAHEMADALGPDRCVALPMFHACTGCDTVSCFGGRGKRTACDMWNAYDEVTSAFCALAATPETVEKLAGSTGTISSPAVRTVLAARNLSVERESSCSHRKVELLTVFLRHKQYFLLHTKRAAYQAGHCWAQTMIATPELPSPSEWGWVQE